MDSALIQKESEKDAYIFLYPKAVDEVQLAIYSEQNIGDREVVAIIDVINSEGIEISAETKGLHRSSSLQAMFRYIPHAAAKEVTHIATLKFPSPAVKVSVRLIDWKTKAKRHTTESTKILTAYRSYLSETSSSDFSCVLAAFVGDSAA